MWSSVPTQASISPRLTARLSALGGLPPLWSVACARSFTTAFGSMLAETCSVSTPLIVSVPSDFTSRTHVEGCTSSGGLSATGVHSAAGTRQPVSPRTK